MSQPAWRTKSGKAIRPRVIRGIAQQIERYDRALKLVDTAAHMVESERPPAPKEGPGKDEDEEEEGADDVSR